MSLRYVLIGIFALSVMASGEACAELMNEEPETASPTSTDDGGKITNPKGIILGLRAGAAFPTQKVLKNTGNGTSIGPLVNVEALYALQEWVRVGLMLEWHQHSIDFWGPKFGTLGVFSILPTVEFRPTSRMRESLGWDSFVNYDLHLRSFIPYAAFSIGTNVHSFSNSNETTNRGESFSTTVAVRAAAGFDIAIDTRWSFNTEVAWNRDSGTYKNNGVEGDFDASSLNLLFGVRLQF
jgi:outer membrane protein